MSLTNEDLKQRIEPAKQFIDDIEKAVKAES